MNQSKTIVIIGGCGQMGQLFTKLLKPFCTVIPFGRDDWKNASNILTKAHAVIVSVPINRTLSVIDKVAKHIKEDCILADFTSIKEIPIQHMLKKHSGPVVGLHPMFGPSIQKPQKQSFLYCEGRNLNACNWLIEIFRNIGFKVHNMTAKQHDEIMNLMQGLQHFNTYCMGHYLKENNINPKTLMEIASPIYKTELNLIGRIFSQDAELYADIIMSDDKRTDSIKNYMDESYKLLTEIQKNDRETFIENFNKIKDWMSEFTKDAAKQTDVMFDSYSEDVE